MTITEIAKITSKGQVTIPRRIRELLHLKEGASVGFGITKDGVVLVPCEISAKSPYTSKEWAKIEKLASEKGKRFSNTKAAKAYLKNL